MFFGKSPAVMCGVWRIIECRNFDVKIDMFERIVIDPKICHGQACIKGTRIPVHQIVGMMANGDSIENLLESYPNIERADVLACLEYAALLAEEQISPIETTASGV